MGDVIELPLKTGYAFFICMSCGIEVMSFVPEDRQPECRVCRFLADHPELPDDIRQRLRDG